MGRPREHDEHDVRAGVMRCFWEQGFEAASVAKLERAARINRRQLFRDYGNKRGLFVQALDDFAGFAAQLYLVRLEREGAGLAAIQDTLRALAKLPNAPDGQLGCLICNTSREPVMQADEEIAERVQAFFRRIEGAYRAAVAGAVERGEVSLTPRKQRATARQLLGIHVAMLVLARSGTTNAVLADIAERTMASLRHRAPG